MNNQDQPGEELSEEDMRLAEFYRDALECEGPSPDLHSKIMNKLRELPPLSAKPAMPLGESRAFDLYAEMTPLERGRLWIEVTRFCQRHCSAGQTLNVEDVVLRAMAMCPRSVTSLNDFENMVAEFVCHVGKAIGYVWREQHHDVAPTFHGGMDQHYEELEHYAFISRV